MVMFGPLGSVIPHSVLADIGLFLDETQLAELSLLSPKANNVVKNNALLHFNYVTIQMFEGKVLLSLAVDGYETRQIEIDPQDEHKTAKIIRFLSMCRSVNELEWSNVTVTDKIIRHLLKVRFGEIEFWGNSMTVTLPLFLKFLKLNTVRFHSVRFPDRLITCKTLKMMCFYNIIRLWTTNEINDEMRSDYVTDDFLEETNDPFRLNGFHTNFTIKRISEFLEKIDHAGTSVFGILPYEQLEDAIVYHREHYSELNKISLCSWNGEKYLVFYVDTASKYRALPGYMRANLNVWKHYVTAEYAIDISSIGDPNIISIPHYVIGTVTQIYFEKFEETLNNPLELISNYQFEVDEMSFFYVNEENSEVGSFKMSFLLRNDTDIGIIERFDVRISDANKFVVAILSNCSQIGLLLFHGIELGEELYQMLKPLSERITIKFSVIIDTHLKSASFEELLTVETGLLGSIDYAYSENISNELLSIESCNRLVRRMFRLSDNVLTNETNSTCLTDQFIHIISVNSVNFMPHKFSFKEYPNKFTANGIKAFIEAIKRLETDPSKCEPCYKLGTINASEVNNTARLVEDLINANEFIVRRVNYSTNEQKYCNVSIKIMFNDSKRIEFDMPVSDPAV